MEYLIEEHAENISDFEINKLLTNAYVGGGFTTPERAAIIFVSSAVRRRGKMIVARTADGVFVGMVIAVRPDAPARRMAEPDEAEIHLLAVDTLYRGNGLGRVLMSKALETIRDMGFNKAVLWTQPQMIPAHRLYESMGFVRAHWRDPVFDGIYFFAYQIECS
ncbi:GNAT family N-acetyltransferase [Planctomycetaceae bacterium SH139]